MKKTLLAAVLFFAFSAGCFAQTITSQQDGPWNVGSTWVGGVVPTDLNSTLVNIAATHSVTIPSGFNATAVSITIAQSNSSDITITSGGSLTHSGVLTTGTLSRGRLFVNGILNIPEGATMVNAGLTSLLIQTGGVYRHNYTTSAGTIYTATWSAGSFLEIAGYTSNTATPAGLTQTFQNFIWNCPNQQADILLTGIIFTTVSGNFTVQDTNGAILGLNTSANRTLTWNGNLTLEPGVIFDINSSVAFNTTINLRGNLSIGSDDGLAIQSSGIGTIVFNGTTSQTFQNSSTLSTPINFQVNSSAILTIADGNFISGPGNLSVSGTLQVGSTNSQGAIEDVGGAGNIQTTGTRTYADGSTIVYNGVSPQFIGLGHPSTTGIHTTIQNSSNVTLADNVVVSGALFLDAGNLILGGRTLTMNDSFTADVGSSLVVTNLSNIAIGIGDAGTFGTLVTSGSAALNNLTFSRNGQTMFLGSNLGINGTFSHDGNINFAGRNLTINGPYTITSGSLIGSATSTLEIAGSGTITGDVPLQGTLGTLTINRPIGVTNTTSINIQTALNILSGTYQGSGSVTLASGATLTRADGTITKSVTATSYNLVYASTAPINTGSELLTSPSTALNNITITNNAVTLNSGLTTLTVNGTLTLTSGTFDTNSKPVFLEGNVVSSATGDFIGSLVTFSGNSTLSGSVSLELDDVEIETGATLNLGTVNLRVAGDFTPEAGSIMQPGSASTFFNGSTILTLPDVATQVQFHNVLISSNSSLTVTCSDCGSENNRPAIALDGIWDSDAFNAVFNPAPNVPSEVTGVRFIGGAQSIRTLAGHSFWDLRLAGTGTVTLQNDLLVTNDLELEGTKTLNTGTNRAISLGGDFLFDGGSFTPNQSTVTFNGTANQTIDRLTGSGTPSFFNITINKAGGSFSNATNVSLTNIFTISTNTAVDFDGPSGTDVFTLASTTSRTAIVAAILSPANPNIVTGNVTAQRYMDGEGRIYRYISAPVTNPQVVDLQGEIPVTGTFTGTSFTAPTNCVGCAPCTGCTQDVQTMFRYNGALAGTVNQRYEDFPAAANTEVMAPTRGYSVFVREASSPTTWNLRGLINRGLQTFTPLAFTGVGADDSYNLVGNPFPSPIDWFVADGATTWARTNIDPTIYTWDNAINNYATYNRMTNTGTNGGSRYVAIGQAFWIRTTAGGASMTANEGAKSSQQPTFFREKQPQDYLRMKLLASNGNSNEALVHFNIEGASDNFDSSIDSYTFPDAALKFFTLSKDARPLAINAFGALDCTREISVAVGTLSPGTYSIQYSEFESFTSPVNIQFLDTYAEKSFVVNAEKPFYEFNVTADSTSFGSNRFKVIFSNKSILGVQATVKNTCAGNEGQINLATSQSDVTYFAAIDGERVSEEMQGNGSMLNIDISGSLLSEGENNVVLMVKYGSCDAVPAQHLKVNVSPVSSVTQVNHASSCQPGKLQLGAKGAKDGSTYRWYESARGVSPIVGANSDTFVTPELESSKSYFVSVVSASGCESDRVEVKAEINPLEPAQIFVEGNTLRSNYITGNRWLKDGEVLSEEASIMTIIPAVYTLEVRSGDCLTAASYEHDLNGIHIFPNPANETITISVESSNEVEVEIFNNIGVRQGAVTLKPAGTNRRSGTFDMSAGASGMYLIQIKDGAKLHLKKILKR